MKIIGKMGNRVGNTLDLSDREKVLIGLDLLFDELTETEYSGDK